MKKFALYLFIVLTLMSCGQGSKNLSLSTTKANNRPVENKDSLPFEKYWKIVEDTLKCSSTNGNEHCVLDTSITFKIIKGHFTSIEKDECLLQRTFYDWKGGRFDFACIFSFENNSWNFEYLFREDSLMLIDVDKDSVFEFFYFEDWVGNGSVDREYRLESLKNNKKKILFEDVENHDNRKNYCAFSISGIGDTVYNWSKYAFEDKYKNEPLILKSTVRYGIKKGSIKENGNDKLIIRYAEYGKAYTFEGEKYK
jgi:hypothetical protein